MHRPRTHLISGDLLTPSDFDVVAQLVDLPLGQKPKGDGWRILTGSPETNLWARVAYRHEARTESEAVTLGELLDGL